MKTYIPKIADVNKDKKWYLIDLKGVTLGRAAIEVANILRGKNKPIFTPHMDTGDFVIAVNASQMKVTGAKAEQKKYYRYTGYPGGLRVTSFEKMMLKPLSARRSQRVNSGVRYAGINGETFPPLAHLIN